jgi:hypothetical protein
MQRATGPRASQRGCGHRRPSNLSHFFTIRPELLEISQEVVDLLLILQAGVDHLGAGNFAPRILDVLAKGRLVPQVKAEFLLASE